MNYSTPNNVDGFTRVMAGAFDERDIIGTPTGFQAFFGRPETGGQTLFSPDHDTVDIDIVRGSRTIAPLIRRGTVSRLVQGRKSLNEGKHSTFSRVFPLIEETGDINATQLTRRQAGENPYAQRTRLDRIRSLAYRQYIEATRRIIRTNEVLAAQAILTGKMDAIIGTTDTSLQYDFLRDSGNTITVSAKWGSGTQVILADIDGACDVCRATGNITPDMMLVGGGAMDLVVKDTNVKAVADNRRFELIEVSTGNPVPARFNRFVAAGFTPRGRLRTPKGYELWMFTYVDSYTNLSGADTLYMPTDKALITSSRARCDRYYGPPELLPPDPSREQMYQFYLGIDPSMPPAPPNVSGGTGIFRPESLYADMYLFGNQKGLTIRVQQAPIFVPVMTDAFVVLQGLV